ncbi:family 10 glycosylhydrolase [Paenibacillus larvae]|nr:family 10 glycosylhydrolase [Paenibacillus larvae]MDT2294964.1 family 10 glycosylhydrolase [Paenibacillus larvae]
MILILFIWTITSILTRSAGKNFDDAAFRTYGNGFGSKADWRRDNVNQLVKDLSHEIKWAKTYVKFGISPFGYGATSHPTRTVQIQER